MLFKSLIKIKERHILGNKMLKYTNKEKIITWFTYFIWQKISPLRYLQLLDKEFIVKFDLANFSNIYGFLILILIQFRDLSTVLIV